MPKRFAKEAEVQVYHEKVENLIQELHSKIRTKKDKYLQKWILDYYYRYEES